MHNKVVFRAAAGLLDAGLLTVKFNFRGVGGSSGVHDEIVGGREDVADVLRYVESEYPEDTITLAGFSFGSRTGLEAAIDDPKVKRLISIGTPVDKYDDYDFLIGLQKPILFVHGDSDEFGSIETLKPLIDKIAATADTELVVFNDCGHFFDEHLNELREAVRIWTEKKLSEE